MTKEPKSLSGVGNLAANYKFKNKRDRKKDMFVYLSCCGQR